MYFNEYLFVGGIDPNPTPFTGTDPNELKRMSTAEQCDATATAGASGYGNDDRFYNGNREIWSVDFSGVAAGFFSSLQPITGWEPEPTEMAIGVVENFLRYVLYHEVCPEYDSDVKKALQVCQDAREEIPMLLRLQVAFPGQLNLAAAKAFGVHDEIDWSLHESFTPADDPKLTLIASLALMDEPGAFERISEWDRRVVRQFECTLEVTRIQRPDSEVVKRFKSLQLADTDGTSAPTPSPVGKARFKPAVIEDQWENPVTTPKCSPMLYLDDDILANMKVGMTITLTICELDVGFRFVKTIHKVVPTYYTFLPQLMMRHFKTPRDMNRPAPSIHDRGGDEAIDGRDVSETGD